MARFHLEVADFLYRAHLDIKSHPGRAIGDDPPKEGESLDDCFRRHYGVGHLPLGVIRSGPQQFNPLYRHLYDIPWQCGLMRSLDLLREPCAIADRGELLQQIHLFNQGRGLFAIVMEFFLHDTETAMHRLMTAIHLVGDALRNNHGAASTLPPDIHDKLKAWLGEPEHVTRGKTLKGFIKSKQILNHSARERWLPGLLDDPCIAVEPLPRYFGSADDGSAYAIKGMFSYIPPTEADAYRTADHLAGLKLSKLQKVLADQQALPRELWPLKAYLEVRYSGNGEERGEFYERILGSLGQPYEAAGSHGATVRPKHGRVEYWAAYLIGRAALAAPVQTPEEESPKHTVPLYEVLAKQRWFYGSTGFRPSSVHVYWHNLLGRYDGLQLAPAHSICRRPLPYFPQNGKTLPTGKEPIKERKFIPMFLRQEMAWKLRLQREDANPRSFQALKPWSLQKVVGCISVALQRRSMRLDFLYRLLPPPPDAARPAGDKPREHLEDLWPLLKNDWAFLTDGWEDIFIVITGKPEDRLKSVFKIQSILYNDFMVDRAEAILTTRCLSFALSRAGLDQGFRTNFSVRFIEDRLLRNIKMEFLQNVRRLGLDLQKKGWPELKIKKLTGRMDFVLSFDEPNDDWKPSEREISQELYELLRSPWIDRIRTQISLNEISLNPE